MRRVRYVHWQEEEFHLGYLEDYPDYMTQGKSLEDLTEHLRDLHRDLTSGAVPYPRKVDELLLS
jgi:predicted RNase H-like HicB family nuclease